MPRKYSSGITCWACCCWIPEIFEAIPELEMARKRFNREAAIYFALGNAYARAGRKTEAAEARENFRNYL